MNGAQNVQNKQNMARKNVFLEMVNMDIKNPYFYADSKNLNLP
jgi:hypothetical protein